MKKKKTVNTEFFNIINDAIDWMLDYNLVLYGQKGFDSAWETFWLNKPITIESENPLMETFSGFFLFNWASAGNTSSGSTSTEFNQGTIAENFLKTRGAMLNETSRMFIESSLNEPFSFFQVLHVGQNNTIKLKDLLLNRTITLFDLDAKEYLIKWSIVFGKTAKIPNHTIWSSAFRAGFPPNLLPVLQELIKSEFSLENLTQEELVASAKDVVILLQKFIDKVISVNENDLKDEIERNPHFVNSFYRYEPDDVDLIRQNLSNMTNVQPLSEDRFIWVVNSKEGQDIKAIIDIRSTTILTKSKNARSNTTLRQKLKTHLDGTLHFIHSEKVKKEVPPDIKDKKLIDFTALPDAAREEFIEVIDQQFLNWASTPIPEFKGKTPQQMVHSETGKQTVINLINEWERELSLNLDLPHHFDFNKLRRRLGLLEH